MIIVHYELDDFTFSIHHRPMYTAFSKRAVEFEHTNPPRRASIRRPEKHGIQKQQVQPIHESTEVRIF